jgi:hypothetical protein
VARTHGDLGAVVHGAADPNEQVAERQIGAGGDFEVPDLVGDPRAVQPGFTPGMLVVGGAQHIGAGMIGAGVLARRPIPWDEPAEPEVTVLPQLAPATPGCCCGAASRGGLDLTVEPDASAIIMRLGG